MYQNLWDAEKAGLRGKYITPILRSKKISNKWPNSNLWGIRKKNKLSPNLEKKRKNKV